MRSPLIAAAIFATLLGGTGPAGGSQRRQDARPFIISAKMPLYPGVAWAAKITGKVVIQADVRKGGVVAARVLSSPNRYLGDPSLANIRTWQFSDWPESGSFTVTFTYKIEGPPTDYPVSPKVVLDLPQSVTIIARPTKPTVMY